MFCHYASILQLLLLLVPAVRPLQDISYFYGGGQICRVDVRLETGCSRMVPGIRSGAECAVSCTDNLDCIGSSLDENGGCFEHFQCPDVQGSTSSCPVPTTNGVHRFFSKNCANGGSWDPGAMGCRCMLNGWVGESCQELGSTNCQGLMELGYPDGDHSVSLDIRNSTGQPVEVTCTLSNEMKYSHILIMNNNGRVDFNRSRNDYRDGFHNDTDGSLIWIGLENWHGISQAGYTRLFVVVTIQGLGTLYRYYNSFKVSHESFGYSYSYGVTVDNKRGDVEGYYYKLADCFRAGRDAPFKTRDDKYDYDNSSHNCASDSGSAWWWPEDCDMPCNLLGWGTEFWKEKLPSQLMRVEGIDFIKERERHIETNMYVTLP